MRTQSKQKLVRTVSDSQVYYLIKIIYFDNEGTESDFYYCNCDEDKAFVDPDTNEEVVYTGCYFQITPPEKTSTGINDAKLTFTALDNVWIEKIRDTKNVCQLRIVGVIEYDEEGSPYIDPIETLPFLIKQAVWNEQTIQFSLTFDNLLDISVPLETVDKRICPSLA